ncbi:hypothetical protein V7S43_005070 [Phytophthora oleae]|uniref:Uncharacterized protein n=1 Tax=Phytophthora oleae TaxID=2107226 RepID=A0ABD3FTZ1_9STRA
MKQIDELKASIDNEKRRRGTALAAVIAQEWKHKLEEFERLAGQVGLKGIPHLSHEQLAGTYTELNRIGEEVLSLQSKLKNRLSGDGTGTTAQFEEVKELSKALSGTMSEWTKMERFRQGLCVDVARRDDAIYTLAKELIAEAHLWLK